MALSRETLERLQDDAVTMLGGIVNQSPDNELQVKSAAVKVQAAALLMNLDLSLTKDEVQEQFRLALASSPDAARQIASSLDLELP